MKLTPIVDRLKGDGLRGVHGVLEFAGLREAPRGTSYYVVPSSEDAGPNSLVGEAGANDQLVEEAFDVIIVTESAARREDRISDALEDLKVQVRDAIAGWKYPGHARACEWAGGRLLTIDSNALAWAVKFRTAWHYRRME